MLRVARIEREHQPVEEAPPVPRGLDEQPVHCGGQPQYRQPFAERRRRGGCAVDAHDPPSRLRGLHPCPQRDRGEVGARSEEHTSELQSLMRNSYAVLCLKKKKLNKLDKSILRRR